MAQKMTLEQVIKSITAFYIDPALEAEYKDKVRIEVAQTRQEMQRIDTLSGLRDYVASTPESLSRIITLLGVSEEKFKRIITMLRIKKNYVPTGEWSISVIRNMMLDHNDWMDEICQLFLNGSQLLKYQSIIPPFYLDNFVINSATMQKLNDESVMTGLIKKSMEGTYNNQIGDKYLSKMFAEASSVARRSGFECSKLTRPFLGKDPSFVIHDGEQLIAIFYSSYSITTSSTQSTFAKDIQKIKETLKERADRIGERVLLITLLDGAGWIARQSDLRTIVNASDYVLNLQTINKLPNILEEASK